MLMHNNIDNNIKANTNTNKRETKKDPKYLEDHNFLFKDFIFASIFLLMLKTGCLSHKLTAIKMYLLFLSFSCVINWIGVKDCKILCKYKNAERQIVKKRKRGWFFNFCVWWENYVGILNKIPFLHFYSLSRLNRIWSLSLDIEHFLFYFRKQKKKSIWGFEILLSDIEIIKTDVTHNTYFILLFPFIMDYNKKALFLLRIQ